MAIIDWVPYFVMIVLLGLVSYNEYRIEQAREEEGVGYQEDLSIHHQDTQDDLEAVSKSTVHDGHESTKLS